MLEINQELSQILSEIKQYNQMIFDNTPKNEKIDFSKTKINWGTTVIPEKFWLKEGIYETVNGYKAIIDGFKLKSNNKEITYPLKGFVIIPQVKGKDKKVRTIWTLDGRNHILNKNKNFDLINIE